MTDFTKDGQIRSAYTPVEAVRLRFAGWDEVAAKAAPVPVPELEDFEAITQQEAQRSGHKQAVAPEGKSRPRRIRKA